MGGNKKKNKNNANANANGNIKSDTKRKAQGMIHEKQEENRDRTFDELDSSLVSSREGSENKVIRKADDVAETPEEPVELSRTTEKVQDAIEAEQFKDEFLQDDLSQPERLVNETELPSTITKDELDSGDVSSDTYAKNQVPTNVWSFDVRGVRDVTDSKDGLDDEEAQVSQEDVEGTTSKNEKKDVVVPAAEDIVCRSELEDEAAPRKHCGSVPSAQPDPHQQPSLIPPKQPLCGSKTPTQVHSSKSRASIKLPAQKLKLDDQPAPFLQPILEQPTIRPTSTELQLSSRHKATRESNTHTLRSTIQHQGTQIPKPTTRDRGTQTSKSTVRDQGIQTEASIDASAQEPKVQGRPASQLRGIFQKPSNTPAQERLGPEQATRFAKPDSPRKVQRNLVPPLTLPLQPVQTLSTTNGPILKLIVNNNTYSFVANREHVLAANTTYFSTHAREHTVTPFGRDFGRYVNFSGKQFSLEVTKEYSQWLCDGIIRTLTSLVRFTPANVDSAFRFLASCYVFGEHIDDKRWMNDIIDAFISVHIRDWRLEMDHVILYTYEFTKQTSPMRRLLVDMYAYWLKPSDNVRVKLKELPTEFAMDIIMALNAVGTATVRDWRERLNNPRVYHI